MVCSNGPSWPSRLADRRQKTSLEAKGLSRLTPKIFEPSSSRWLAQQVDAMLKERSFFCVWGVDVWNISEKNTSLLESWIIAYVAKLEGVCVIVSSETLSIPQVYRVSC